jgi:hypothetical protein
MASIVPGVGEPDDGRAPFDVSQLPDAVSVLLYESSIGNLILPAELGIVAVALDPHAAPLDGDQLRPLLFRDLFGWPGLSGCVEDALRALAALDPSLMPSARIVRVSHPVPIEVASNPALVLDRLGAAYFTLLLDSAYPWNSPDRNLRVWTCGELLRTTFEQRAFLVGGLLADGGLTVLSGAPKRGKSWLALQLAEAVAAGGTVLGEAATKASVVYFALEDSPPRIKDRLRMHGVTEPLPIRFVFEVGPLDRSGAAEVEQHVAETGARLVIVDTITQARSSGLDENEAGTMNALLASLRRLA